MSRRKSREKILQVIYCVDMADGDLENCLEIVKNPEDNVDWGFVEDMCFGILRNLTTVDLILKRYLEGWKPERLGKVERAILRIGVFELLFYGKTPPKVVINEAVELAKKFSSETAARFVNGVLGHILRDIENLRRQFRIGEPKPSGIGQDFQG